MMKNLHESLKIPYGFLFETEPEQTEEIIISFANKNVTPNIIAKCCGRIKHKDSILKEGLRLNSIITADCVPIFPLKRLPDNLAR